MALMIRIWIYAFGAPPPFCCQPKKTQIVQPETCHEKLRKMASCICVIIVGKHGAQTLLDSPSVSAFKAAEDLQVGIEAECCRIIVGHPHLKGDNRMERKPRGSHWLK